MSKNQNITKPNKQTPTSFIETLPSEKQRKEAKILLKTFTDAVEMKPIMWGSIFGFGSYHYKYESGREGDFMATGFAMRKSGPVVYIMPGYNDYSELLEKLGSHKLGKSCLYLKNLDDINLAVLKKLIKAGLKDLKKIYPVKD